MHEEGKQSRGNKEGEIQRRGNTKKGKYKEEQEVNEREELEFTPNGPTLADLWDD